MDVSPEARAKPNRQQIGKLWECFSGAFMTRVEVVMNIPRSTEQTAEAVLDTIAQHLRRQRNSHEDMRDFLDIRQVHGQSIVDLVGQVDDLANYADIEQITSDRLKMAILIRSLMDPEERRKSDGAETKNVCRSGAVSN